MRIWIHNTYKTSISDTDSKGSVDPDPGMKTAQKQNKMKEKNRVLWILIRNPDCRGFGWKDVASYRG